MTKEELIERLAEKEHASWARWMAYLFSKCEREVVTGNPDDLVIEKDLVRHWQRQIDTPYADLTEREKQSDREEVAHILPIIEEYVTQEVGIAILWQIYKFQQSIIELMGGVSE
jgi:hypothetical protein